MLCYPILLVLLCTATTTRSSSLSTLGLDVSNSFDSTKQWTCLQSSTVNRTWGIVRAYHSYGGFDKNSIATLNAAHASGLTNMDVYLFPCSTKKADAQAQDMVKQLGTTPWNSVWIDIETNPSTGCGWSNNTKNNCQFLEEMINYLTGTGTAVGVYSSHYEWSAVMGDSCTVAQHLPLWYARYSYGASCNDYSTLPFGGWTKPFAKQYSDQGDAGATSCGFHSADMNVRC